MPIKVVTQIYFLFDTETMHGYVGKSTELEIRTNAHWVNRYLEKNYKNHWLRTLSSPPECRVLENCSRDWAKRETYWIARMKREGWTLTNLTKGGEGAPGLVMPEEQKERIRASMMGRPSPMKGRKHSKETRRRMSAAHKGNSYRLGTKTTEETREKMSRAHSGSKNHFYGKSHTEASKKKMSISSLEGIQRREAQCHP